MRIVFMGTPDLAATSLQALWASSCEIPLVVTQADKPYGRGKKMARSPVKVFAEEKNIPVIQPTTLKDAQLREKIVAAAPDVIVVVAYGRLLPPEVLALAPLGCLNVHASILPSYRGAAPIQWALLNGEGYTGVSIMLMDEGLDTGPILRTEIMPIQEDMDYGALYDALAEMGAALLLETLPMWAKGELTPVIQDPSNMSYAPPVYREQEMIHWDMPWTRIRNQVRAFSPSPGACTMVLGKEIKILSVREWAAKDRSESSTVHGIPGRIVEIVRRQGPVVETGDGLLLITRVCPAGKKPMDAWAWLNGSPLVPGQIIGEKEN